MTLILNVKSITWDLTDDDANLERPPTTFQIELSNDWINDFIERELSDPEAQVLSDLIEDKYPFCYEDVNFNITPKRPTFKVEVGEPKYLLSSAPK